VKEGGKHGSVGLDVVVPNEGVRGRVRVPLSLLETRSTASLELVLPDVSHSRRPLALLHLLLDLVLPHRLADAVERLEVDEEVGGADDPLGEGREGGRRRFSSRRKWTREG
jgi:hypothetical protein